MESSEAEGRVNSTPCVKERTRMSLGKWKLFGGYHRAYSSEAYKDTMRAVEHLASNTLLLLDSKPADEQSILTKARSLSDKLADVAGTETPLVVALAFLTSIRVLERVIQQQANQRQS
jgi:hypothetical protein